MKAPTTYTGTRNPLRRQKVERGESPGIPEPGGTLAPLVFKPYRKTALAYAARIDEPFRVETLEGMHDGKAGDYLAIGAAGEMYPIDAAVFAATYEPAD